MRRQFKEYLPEGYSVKVARSVEEVEEMRPIWERMQCNHSTDIDIYLNDLKVIEGSRPHVILLSLGSQPQALIVGRLVERRIDFKIGYKTLYKPKVRLLSVVYGGVIAEQSNSNCGAIISELISSLREEADMVIINCLRLDSDIYRFAKKKPAFFCRDYVSDVKLHSKINLPDNINEFLRRLKSEHKRYFNRHFYSCDSRSYKSNSPCRMYKVLEKEHQKVTFKCFKDKEEVEQLCNDSEEIAKETYQRGLGTGFFYSKEKDRRAFLAERGWLRGYVLYVNNKPCAFWIGFIYREKFLSEFLGYLPNYKKYEPGTLLLINIIEDLSQSKVKELDFGVGEATYKKRFGDQHWAEATVYIFAPTLKGVRLNIARTITFLISQFIGGILNRFGLLGKIKRRWRNFFIQRQKRHTPSGQAST